MFYKLLQFLILVMAIFYNCYLKYFEQTILCLIFILCILPLDVVYHNSRSVKFEKLLLPPKEKQTNDIKLHALMTFTSFLSLPLCVVAAY